MNLIEAKSLQKRFGAVTAARDVSVAIPEKTVTSLIGTNGAGKTTFVNMVTGYLKPDEGTIHFKGQDITPCAPREVTRLGICRSFQIPQLFSSLDTKTNVIVALGVALRNKQTGSEHLDQNNLDHYADEILARFDLQPYASSEAGKLPEGIRKLLDIALATVSRPSVLLLDEPTSGVASEEKFLIMDRVMTATRDQGVTILFVEHDMEIVRRYSDRVIAFYDGGIIADGDPEVVLTDDKVCQYVIGHQVTTKENTDVKN